MILKYYKSYIPLEILREMMQTNKNGTTAFNLVNTLEELGFNATGYKIKIEELFKEDIITPCIAHTIIDNSYNHYIVIYKIDKKNKTLLIADPANSKKKISMTDFSKIYNNVIIQFYPIRKLNSYQKTKSLMKLVLTIIKQNKSLFFKIILLSIFLTGLGIILSFYIYFILEILNKKSIHLLLLIFSIFLIPNIIKIFINYIRNKILIVLNEKIDIKLVCDGYENIILLPYNYFRNRTTGEVISRLNDLNLVRQVISKLAIVLTSDILLAIGSSIVLYILSRELFLISTILLILYLVIICGFKKIYNKMIDKVQQERSIINSYMVESIQSFETIKGLNIEENNIKNFKRKYVLHQHNLIKLDRYLNIENILKDIVSELGLLITFLVGGFMIINNNLSISILITFNLVLEYFLEPIKNMINLNLDIKEARNALRRVEELKYINPYVSKQSIDYINQIEINNLTFKHNDNVILKNIDLNITSKDKLIIIGPSGSGKSTLLKILKGYYKVDNCIKINNINIENIDSKILNQKIKYISQNEFLYTNTLYNNLTLDRNIADKDIDEIIKLVYIDEIVKNNNLGLNMLIEENGFNISGGERQRIVLGRSLLEDFNILIIDEALNQVDITLERKILKNILNKFKDKIIIFVSHRNNNIDLFDKLIELNDGEITKGENICLEDSLEN